MTAIRGNRDHDTGSPDHRMDEVLVAPVEVVEGPMAARAVTTSISATIDGEEVELTAIVSKTAAMYGGSVRNWLHISG